MAAITPKGEPTPPREDSQNSGCTYASYVPHDLKYSADFEDSIVAALLDGDSATQNPGLRIIPDDSDEIAVKDVSIRAQDISQQSLPSIAEEDLPLPLDDPRRIFASSVPGIRLTHPGGYLEGGPGLDPDMDTFPDDFLSNKPAIGSPAELRALIAKDVAGSVESLKERLRARQRAREKNEQIERDLKTLMDNHDMELKMQRRMAEENERKREAREKKRQAKSGG